MTIDDNNEITGANPMRVTCRGFSEECNDIGYKKVAKFLRNNAKELYDEAEYKEINN